MSQNRKLIEGEDIPFGPPPEEYSYRCSQCNREFAVNEAIIDVEIGLAEFEGRYYEGFMPVLGCPGCNQETLEYVPG
ncbi:MAG: hypothetical protein PF503_20270 [Desulfobacula sp.]|jgi:hypothetical protein|nr:hypothetical protein [Desulfobacula sp.]